ncbi:hypothetical protein AB5N19_02000 [Seiridium cardinale]
MADQVAPAPVTSDVLIALIVYEGDPRNRTHYVYKSVLCSRAPLFIELTHDVDQVCFPSWRGETVETFVGWLHSGRVMVRGLNYDGVLSWPEALRCDEDDNCTISAPANSDEQTVRHATQPWYTTFKDDAVAHTLGRVLDVYIFAHNGRISALETECILVWQRQLCSPNDIFVFGPMIKAVIERSGGQEHMLWQFLFEWTAFNINDDFWDRGNLTVLSPDILCKITRLVARRANFGVETERGVPNPSKDWCLYHGHASQEEIDACRAGRPEDPDIRQAADYHQATSTPSDHGYEHGLKVAPCSEHENRKPLPSWNNFPSPEKSTTSNSVTAFTPRTTPSDQTESTGDAMR